MLCCLSAVAMLLVGCGKQTPVTRASEFDDGDMQQFTNFLWQTTDGTHTQIGFEHSGDELRVLITLNLNQVNQRQVTTVLAANEYQTTAQQTGLGRVLTLAAPAQELLFTLRQNDDYDTLEYEHAKKQTSLLKTQNAK